MAKSGLPAPTPIALVLCDNVYKASNGKQALVGLFNRVVATSFPAIVPRLCAYVSITSVRPNTTVEFEIVHGETDEPVIRVNGPAPSSLGDPTTVWDAVFEMEPIVFPTAGRYYARFLGNGQTLVQRHFEVIDANSLKNEQNEENEDVDEE